MMVNNTTDTSMPFGIGKKYWIFTVLAILIFYLVYKFSFEKTIALKEKINENEQKIAYMHQAPGELSAYQEKLEKLNQKKRPQVYKREQLFEIINTFCRANNLQILNFHPEARSDFDNFLLITNELELKGDYKTMLKLIWLLEYETNYCHIASAKYEMVTDKRTKDTYLSGYFVMQNYTQK